MLLYATIFAIFLINNITTNTTHTCIIFLNIINVSHNIKHA